MCLAVSFVGRKKRIFWTYGSKVMDVWIFKEKSRQGGHVLQPMRKSWPIAQKVEGRKKKKFKKNGYSPTGWGINPRLAGDRWSPAGPGPPTSRRRPQVDASTCRVVPSFLKKNYLKKNKIWKFGKWARAFGRMGVQYLHFLKLALTLGSANSSKIHGERRFHFFPKKNPKFSLHLDLPIYHWDFCFMKSWIH
jgi:hypothetical protein